MSQEPQPNDSLPARARNLALPPSVQGSKSGVIPPAKAETYESTTIDVRPITKCVCILGPKGRSRNLVVCIDGTGNQFSLKVCFCFLGRSHSYLLLQNTNVIELYSRLEKDEEQLT